MRVALRAGAASSAAAGVVWLGSRCGAVGAPDWGCDERGRTRRRHERRGRQMGISILVVGERKGALKKEEEEGAARSRRRRRRRKLGIGAPCQPTTRKGWLWPLVLVCSSAPASLSRKRDSSERAPPESGRVSITITITTSFIIPLISHHLPEKEGGTRGRKEGREKELQLKRREGIVELRQRKCG